MTPLISMNSLDVPINIEADCRDLGEKSDIAFHVRRAAIAAAASQGFTSGIIGVLITDDETIHQINREHLDHDYPTDVISFAYSKQSPRIEGELVASLDTAKREAAALEWSVLSELLLYVVHGSLHICGLEDSTDEQRIQMRHAEQRVLSELGIANSIRFAPERVSSEETVGQTVTPTDSCLTC